MAKGAGMAGESVPRALEAVVERLLALTGPAYQLAVRVLGSHQGAEDVVQQAYLEAIARIRGGNPPLEERTWFLRVVANEARDHLKLEARRRKREAVVATIEKTGTPEGDAAELTGLLRGAMDALEDTYRVPVALCHEQGLTRREAAAVLDLPERTVSNHVQEGLERLRGILARNGYSAQPAMIVAGLGSATAPVVPAGLAAAVRSLVVGGLAAGQAAVGAGTAAASGSLALGWKLLAGLSVAAALGAGAFTVLMPGRPDLPAAPAAPAEARGADVTVTGKVLDQDGKPVEGVRIKLAVHESPGSYYPVEDRESVSGADGSFSVTVASGSIRLLRVRAPSGSGLFAADVKGAELCAPPEGSFGSSYFQIKPTDGKASLVVSLAPGSARVAGLVTGPDGKPVAGATVMIANGATGTRTRRGVLSLLAAGPGGWSTGPDAIAATTGADGRYSVAVPPGVYYPGGACGPEGSMLRARGHGGMMFGMGGNVRRVRAGGLLEFDTEMQLGGALELAVQDEAGKPVPGAEVHLHAAMGSGHFGARITGPEGTVTLYGLDPLANVHPKSYSVQVTAPVDSRLATMIVKVDPPEAGKLARREIRLPVGAAVAGRVTDEEGKALAGLRLSAVRVDNTAGNWLPVVAGRTTATAGEDGKYAFRNLPAGKFRIQAGAWNSESVLRFANGKSSADPVEVAAGAEKTCDFVLHRARLVNLTGRITDRDGKPVREAAIYNGGRRRWRGAGVAIPLGGANAEPEAPVAMTDADGRYRMTGLLSGRTLGLTVEPPGERPLAQEYVTVELEEVAENRKDICLPPATVVKVTVVDAEGRPAAGRQVTVQDLKVGVMSTAAISDPSGEDGLAVVRLRKWDRWNPGEERQLWIFESNAPREMSKVNIPARDDQVVEHKLTCRSGGPAAPVSFTVVDEAGKPLPGADVTLVSAVRVKQFPTMLYSRQWPSDSTEEGADADGRLVIEDVAGGEEYVAVAAFLCDDARRMISSVPEIVKVEGGTRVERRLTARLGGTARLSVLGPDGAKVHAQIRLIDPRTGLAVGQSIGRSHWNPSGPPEDHRIVRLPPGKYKVEVDVLTDVPGKGKRFRPAPDLPETFVEVEPGKALEQEIRLGGGAPPTEVF